jgi:ABC-type polysaccharide/polyol phosphate export permease
MASGASVRFAQTQTALERTINVVQALVVREFKGRYCRSLLGPTWAIIQPSDAC